MKARPIFSAGFSLLSGIFVFLCLAKLCMEPMMLGRDSAIYFLAARSLLSGHGYVLEIGGPALQPLYPPGYSLFLSLFVWTFPKHVWVLRLTSLLPCLGAALILWKWFGKSRRGLLFCGIFFFNPVTLDLALAVRPEMFFIFLVSLILWLARDDVFGGERGYFGRLGGVLLLACLSVYVKTAGIALVLSAGLCVWLSRWKISHKLLATAFMAALLSPCFFAQSKDYVGRYFFQSDIVADKVAFGWRPFIERISGNVAIHLGRNMADFVFGGVFQNITRAASGSFFFGAKTALSLFVGGLVLAGWWRSLRRRTGLAGLFFIFYTGLVLSWPWYKMEYRFLFPLFPLLFYYFWAGARGLMPRAVFGKAILVCFMGAAVFFSLFQAVWFVGVRKMRAPSVWSDVVWAQRTREFLDGMEWIRTHAEKDAALLCGDPYAVHLYTGRKCFLFPRAVSVSELPGEAGYVYATAGRKDEMDFLGTFQKTAGWEEIFSTPNTRLLKIS